MKKLLLSLLFIPLIFSQELISVHKLHKELFQNKTSEKNTSEVNEPIIPLRFDKSSKENTVFGYLPDWEYTTASTNLRYDLLTHIAAFDFVVNNQGAITNPSGWPWTTIINDAHSNGVKVILTAVCFDTAAISNVLRNTTAKNNFFTNVVSKIKQFSLDGVNVDFEGMGTWLRGDLMNNFMLELTNYVHAQVPGSEVSFAGPAVNWGGWKLAGLAASCDYIFIMGYDFYGSWSTTSGPSAPLLGGSYNITNTVKTQYSAVLTTTPEKLILGVPYYGVKYMTKTNAAHAPITKFIANRLYRDLKTEEVGKEFFWADDNKTPWYRWKDTDTSWYQVWYDSDSSLSLKYDLASSNNLKGIGMWALNYDGARTELWNLIQRKMLPVELVSFTMKIHGDQLQLNWTTSTETNNYGYEIVKEFIGSNKKEIIGFVKGVGNSSSYTSYSFNEKQLTHGKYIYHLVQIDLDGTRKTIASESIKVDVLKKFTLENNYPNPFNPVTTLNFYVPEQDEISIYIYNSLGMQILPDYSNIYEQGYHKYLLNLSEMPSGVYVYKIKYRQNYFTGKMNLLK